MLANLYLHYAFDVWMQRNYPAIPFERYADDVVCHRRNKEEGEALLQDLKERLSVCNLKLHPEKTQLVYCKDGKRRGDYPNTRFDFLGFSFHARTVQDRYGNLFTGFGPSVSRKALKRMNLAIRRLKLHRWTTWSLSELAARINPMVRGWVQYYSAFYPETLKRFLVRLDLKLGRWARNKYKRLRGHKRRAWAWLKHCRESFPKLFVHWDFVFS